MIENPSGIYLIILYLPYCDWIDLMFGEQQARVNEGCEGAALGSRPTASPEGLPQILLKATGWGTVR